MKFLWSTNAIHSAFSSSDLEYGKDYKRGGVFQFSINQLATRTVAYHHDKYGRFTSQTFIGKKGKRLTVIAAYRTTEGS